MGPMNLGIYVKSMTEEKTLKMCIDEIEKGMEENKIDDASIFYEAIGFSPLTFPCGVFNSTDIWNFSGKIVTFSLDCLATLNNIVNNFEVYYCFGFEDIDNVLRLISVSSNAKIISKTKEDAEEYYRLTGNTPIGSLDDKTLLNIIGD